MTPVPQLAHDLARAARCAARAALQRSALVGAALVLAVLGAGFLISAGYTGLRLSLGPGLAALAMGLGLMALAAGLLLLAQIAKRKAHSPAMAAPLAIEEARQPGAADAMTMAVFTAAFLLGRRLADRFSPSGNS